VSIVPLLVLYGLAAIGCAFLIMSKDTRYHLLVVIVPVLVATGAWFVRWIG
jgi:hypothetical protein